MKSIPKCFLDGKAAVDGMMFETGNNAEIAVDLDLCADHLKEQEDTGYAFEQKYSYEILEAAYASHGWY